MSRTQAEAAVSVERALGSSPIVLVCDHASNHLPARYEALGLTAADLLQHFAWDPGALAVSRRLAAILDAPLVYGRVSRLALDVNRDPADPDSIVTQSEAVVVPGNLGLPDSERRRRVAEI
jgi:predicted N-formylglutamate amidohydrolase